LPLHPLVSGNGNAASQAILDQMPLSSFNMLESVSESD
jgi:hypothetical protein